MKVCILLLLLAARADLAENGPFIVQRFDAVDTDDDVTSKKHHTTKCDFGERIECTAHTFEHLPPRSHHIQLVCSTTADRLLVHYHENHAGDAQGTTNISIVYPHYAPIQGNVLTHVHLLVYTAVPSAVHCTIRTGGLRLRHIDLLVTANRTEFLNYDVQFYGL